MMHLINLIMFFFTISYDRSKRDVYDLDPQQRGQKGVSSDQKGISAGNKMVKTR